MYLTYTSGQKVLNIKKINQSLLENWLYLTCTNGQKILNAKKAKQLSLTHKRSQKVDYTKTILLIITTKFRIEDAV